MDGSPLKRSQVESLPAASKSTRQKAAILRTGSTLFASKRDGEWRRTSHRSPRPSVVPTAAADLVLQSCLVRDCASGCFRDSCGTSDDLDRSPRDNEPAHGRIQLSPQQPLSRAAAIVADRLDLIDGISVGLNGLGLAGRRASPDATDRPPSVRHNLAILSLSNHRSGRFGSPLAIRRSDAQPRPTPFARQPPIPKDTGPVASGDGGSDGDDDSREWCLPLCADSSSSADPMEGDALCEAPGKLNALREQMAVDLMGSTHKTPAHPSVSPDAVFVDIR